MSGGGMDAVKAEKERAMLRYRRLRRAAALSRCLLEALAALSLLSWSSARLPSALALCGALRHLPALLFHPLSAFLVGNVIIVTLVAKSSDGSPAAPPPSPFAAAVPPSSVVHVHHRREEAAATTDVVYEDKAMCPESATADAARPKKGFQRTRSEDIAGWVAKKDAEETPLHRSQSEASVVAGAKVVAEWWEEGEAEEEVVADDGDEFRQKIEAFIARQQRFIEREEESLLLAAKAASIATGARALRVAAGAHVNDRR